MSLRSELARRAKASFPPREQGHGSRLSVVLALLGVLGPAVITPIGLAVVSGINDRARAAATLANARQAEQSRLADDVAAAKRTCGEALSKADAAQSQATAANVAFESLKAKPALSKAKAR